MINYGKQQIIKKDIDSVVKTLKSNFLTTGPATLRFEESLKKKIKSKYALSCSSGTAAIHLSLLAIGIKKNDVIIMPVINFVASANLVSILGAKIIFSDVNQLTGQMTPKDLLNCIKKNNLRKIKAVITMYNGGDPLNAKEFYKIKKKYGFFLIEDSCHALGSKYYTSGKHYIGSCKFSDISTFSFHPVKSITTCEGGLITTNKKFVYDKIKILRNHGMVKKKKKNYVWDYKIVYPGLNYRLSDVSSALGHSQLKRLDKIINDRKKIAQLYVKKLISFNEYINLPNVVKSNSSFHLFIINFNLKKLKINRDKIIQILYEKKIKTQVHYIPISNHPYYKKNLNFKLPESEKYFLSCLSLPIYPGLTKRQINYVCLNLEKIIKKYKK